VIDVHAEAPAQDAFRAPANRPSVLRTTAEVETARRELEAVPWTCLDPVPEYALAVVRVRPEVHGPYVQRLIPASGDEVVFVGRLENVPLTVSAGYQTLYRPTLRAITLVHGGVHGATTTEAADALVASLRDALRAGEADVLRLPSIEVGTPLHAAARSVPRSLQNHFRRRSTHWALRLPDSFDEFVRSRSKKTRENLRVYRNRLHRDHGDALSLRVYHEPGEHEELLRVVEKVAAKTYQRGLGVAPPDSLEERTLTALQLERGWYRAWVLSANDRPIAFWSGAGFNGTFLVGTPGYDPEFAEYSIGTYLLMRVIEDLIADDAIHSLDYGLGESEYKRRFGSDSWEEEDVLIFAPSFRGVRVNATRTALEGAVALGRGVAARTGLTARIKRRWRRRLARGATSPVG
jgi:CelD/BcsL family acetyltransferase involved in cellulose biosynthesis